MEHCPHGNLREFLHSSRNFYDINQDVMIPDDLFQAIGPKTLMYFAWQITKGMTFLISRKVNFKQHFSHDELSRIVEMLCCMPKEK